MQTFRLLAFKFPAFGLLGAMAVLSAAIATPVMAQQVIYEPGYCAFFYPNANCQNKGPGNPYSDPNYRRSAVQNDAIGPAGAMTGTGRKRLRKHHAASSAARTQ
jgi:ABC-type multidrug transport system permease subunit